MVQGKPITGVLIDKDSPVIKAVTIKDCLDDYYRVLDCDTIEHTYRVIGGVEYDLICDEEGGPMLDPDAVCTAIDSERRKQIFGNIFIVLGNDETGEWESLTDEDVENILHHAYLYRDDEGTIRPLIQMDGPYGMGAPAEADAEAEAE